MHYYNGKLIHRKAIVAYLNKSTWKQRTTEAICRDLNLDPSTCSNNIKQLLDDGIVERERNGRMSIIKLL